MFFLDEIHRFNKAQQDALLPAVEDGPVTLIGATTENPDFEVNSALLSRLRIYELRGARRDDDVQALLRRALERARIADAPRSPTTRSTSWPPAPAATRAPRSTRSSWRPRPRARTARRRSPSPRTPSSARPSSTTRAATALRPDLRLDQVDARADPDACSTPRRDARGRRGPALHRPAHGSWPARTSATRTRRRCGRGLGGAGGRARRAPRGALNLRAGRGLPRARAEVERLRRGSSSAPAAGSTRTAR